MPTRPCRRMPALFTSTSILPCSFRTAAIRSRAKAGSATSPRRARAGCSEVDSWAARASTASPRAVSTSVAPWAAKARAMPAPMPRLAPVTSATRPSSSIEARPEPGQGLSGLADGAHSQNVVGVEHDVELGLELHDERHVCHRVPLLDAVVGEVVGDSLGCDPERAGEAVAQLVDGHAATLQERGRAIVRGLTALARRARRAGPGRR